MHLGGLAADIRLYSVMSEAKKVGGGGQIAFFVKYFENFVLLSLNSAVHHNYTQLCSERCGETILCPPPHFRKCPSSIYVEYRPTKVVCVCQGPKAPPTLLSSVQLCTDYMQ